MQIAEKTVVTIHYTLTNVEGKVLDSSVGEEPLSYLHGTGMIVPGLEKALLGKNEGEQVKVTIPAAEAYGEHQDGMVQTIARSEFPDGDIEVGMQFRAHGPHGSRILSVTAIDDKNVTVDGNHPLAGKDLNFDVKVVSVREATEEDMSEGGGGCCGGHDHGEGHDHGHGHGGGGGGCGSGGCGGCGGH